ncbi:hypothetical protein [Chryseobacterium sp. T1]
MNTFFYRNWWLFYLLIFFLLGILIYAILWQNNKSYNIDDYNRLKNELADCQRLKDPIKPSQPNVVDCNAIVNSGGQGETITDHNLGKQGGVVRLEYDAQNVPDEFTVFYNGKIVATTHGLVSHTGEISWQYEPNSNEPDFCTVKVSAPNEKTVWIYRLNCPE